jgi:hypothetical protein
MSDDAPPPKKPDTAGDKAPKRQAAPKPAKTTKASTKPPAARPDADKPDRADPGPGDSDPVTPGDGKTDTSAVEDAPTAATPKAGDLPTDEAAAPLEDTQDSEETQPSHEATADTAGGEGLGAKVRHVRDAVFALPSMPDPDDPGTATSRSCPECGTQFLTARQRFCTHCGTQRPTQLSASRPDVTAGDEGLDIAQRWAWGLAAAVVVLLVVIAAATSSGNSSSLASTTFPTDNPTAPVTTPDTEPPTPTTTTPGVPTGTPIPNSQLAAGDCFYFPGQPDAVDDAQPQTQVDEVPCDGPHPFETVAVLTYPGATTDPFPGTETIDGYASSQCAPLYQAYTQGSSLDLTSTYFYPSASSWPSDDRTVVCALKDSSGGLLSSSVQSTVTTTTPPTSAPTDNSYSISADDVSVRTGPSTSDPMITQLNTGDQVTVSCSTQGDDIDGNSQWDQISINGQTGYVADQFVNDGAATFPSC